MDNTISLLMEEACWMVDFFRHEKGEAARIHQAYWQGEVDILNTLNGHINASSSSQETLSLPAVRTPI